MTLQELSNLSKKDFIEFSKNFNVFKTLEDPNYLIIKNKIYELLEIHQLTIDSIKPNPRILQGTLETGQIKSKQI